MKKTSIILITFALVGCSQDPKSQISESTTEPKIYEFVNKGQSPKIEEVVYGHNDIQNLKGLDKFIKNIENQNEAKINFIQYGIEG